MTTLWLWWHLRKGHSPALTPNLWGRGDIWRCPCGKEYVA